MSRHGGSQAKAQPSYPSVWSRLRQQLTAEEIRADLTVLQAGAPAAQKSSSAGGAGHATDAEAAAERLGVAVPLQLVESPGEAPSAPLQESWLEPPPAGGHGHPPLRPEERPAPVWPPPPPPLTPTPAPAASASVASERPHRSHRSTKRPARYSGEQGQEVTQELIDAETRRYREREREAATAAAMAAAPAPPPRAAGSRPGSRADAVGGVSRLPRYRPPSQQADSHSIGMAPMGEPAEAALLAQRQTQLQWLQAQAKRAAQPAGGQPAGQPQAVAWIPAGQVQAVAWQPWQQAAGADGRPVAGADGRQAAGGPCQPNPAGGRTQCLPQPQEWRPAIPPQQWQHHQPQPEHPVTPPGAQEGAADRAAAGAMPGNGAPGQQQQQQAWQSQQQQQQQQRLAAGAIPELPAAGLTATGVPLSAEQLLFVQLMMAPGLRRSSGGGAEDQR